MKRLFIVLAFFMILFPYAVHAQDEGQLSILSPREGQVVQGLVEITGNVTLLGISSYELSFAYNDDPTETWFVLPSNVLPVFEGVLGTWDTTTLTDGDYSLRLRATLLDGSVQETTVTNLRVRNYTPVPTSTATMTSTPVSLLLAPTAQVIVPAVATAIPSLPTPTPYPDNPVGLGLSSISDSLGRSAILVVLLFLGFGLILRLRRD